MMTGKEKIYFLVDAIDDARTIAPAGQPILVDPTNDLNRKYRGIELDQLFTKLEKDEKVLKVLQTPNRVKNAILQSAGHYREMDDGCYHLKLFPSFDSYFLKIQQEPEYQKFTGKTPPKASVSGVSVDVFVSDLQAKYQDIQDEKNDNRFYLKLSDYGKCLNENEAAYPVLSGLYADSQMQIEELRSHWVEFFKVWRTHATNLVKLADAVGIKDEGPLQDELEKLRGYISESDPQFSDTELPNYWQPYREIILRFGKAGMTDKVAGEHLDGDGNLRLYPEYRKVEVAWDKYKQAREISVWWAHYQISRLAAGVVGSQEDKGHYFKDDNYIDQMYKYEFDKISRGEANTLIFLRRDKFGEWVRRLHSYLIPRLKEQPRNEPTQLEKRYQELLEEIKGLAGVKQGELEQRYENALADIRSQKEDHSVIVGAITSPSLSRKGLEKKWDVLQSIWTVYESNSRADAVLVPIDALTIKGRTVEEIDGIIQGLKNLGCFGTWNRRDRWYSLEDINHSELASIFGDTQSLYKQMAAEFESRKIKIESYKLPNRRDMAKEVTRLKKECELGPKEVKLLKILSDFKQKRTSELTTGVPTDDYKHLKMALAKKIAKEGWVIENEKELVGLVWKYYYRLDRTHPSR